MKAYAINHPETLVLTSFVPSIEDEAGNDYPDLTEPDLTVTWSTDQPSIVDLSAVDEDGRGGAIGVLSAGVALVTCTISGYPNGEVETFQFYLACGKSGPESPTATLTVTPAP